MAFPTIPTVAAGRVVTVVRTAAPFSIDISGLTKNAGDRLIGVIVAYQSTGTANAVWSAWTAGWTEIGDRSSSTTMAIGVAEKISDGTETAFQGTLAATITGQAAIIVMSIAGAHASTPSEVSAKGDGTASAANPPALDPAGWGTEDTLWINVGGIGETATTGSFTGIASAPVNYTDMVATGISADVVGGVQAAVAFKQATAASEDGGAYSIDLSNTRSSAVEIAVRPAPTIITYTPTGSGVSAFTAEGADVFTLNRLGSGISPFVGAGPDVFTGIETGAGVSPRVASATKIREYGERGGSSISAFIATGPDSFIGTETGVGISPKVASGPRQLTDVNTGVGIAPFVGAGGKLADHPRTGIVISPREALGTDSFTGVETGVGISPFISSGSKLLQAPAIDKLGAGIAAFIASGGDVAQLAETGLGISPFVSTGDSTYQFTESGAGVTGSPYYDQEVLVDSPVAYWKFEETGTPATIADSVGTHTGTVTGANWGQIGPIIGESVNRAVGFDGNDRIFVNDANDLDPARITLELWINTTSTDNFDLLVGKTAPNWLWSDGWGAYWGVTEVRFWIGTYTNSLTGTILGTGWHHMVFTYDGSFLRGYVDGIQVSQKPWTTDIVPTAHQLTMGDDGSGQAWVVSTSLARVAVYNTALSPTRILQHYNSGSWSGFTGGGTRNSVFGEYNDSIADDFTNTLIFGSSAIGKRRWAFFNNGATGSVHSVSSGKYKLECTSGLLAGTSDTAPFSTNGNTESLFASWNLEADIAATQGLNGQYLIGVRSSIAAQNPHVAIVYDSDNSHLTLRWRDVSAGASGYAGDDTGIAAPSTPFRLRITTSQDRLTATGYVSTNGGTTWSLIGSHKVTSAIQTRPMLYAGSPSGGGWVEYDNALWTTIGSEFTDSGGKNASFADSGAGISPFIGSGDKDNIYIEQGSGITIFTASGAKVYQTGGQNIYTPSGSGVAIFTGSGGKAVIMSETGIGISPHAASGTDSFTSVDSGSGVSPFTALGGNDLEFRKFGSGVVVLTGSGADAFVASEAGLAAIEFIASGGKFVTVAGSELPELIYPVDALVVPYTTMIVEAAHTTTLTTNEPLFNANVLENDDTMVVYTSTVYNVVVDGTIYTVVVTEPQTDADIQMFGVDY